MAVALLVVALLAPVPVHNGPLSTEPVDPEVPEWSALGDVGGEGGAEGAGLGRVGLPASHANRPAQHGRLAPVCGWAQRTGLRQTLLSV